MASQPHIPTRGERNTQKIFGAVRLDTAQFIYIHQQDYFQWETYVAFLDQVLVPAFYRRGHRVFLIQDNASYHKKRETYQWFAQNRRYVEVFPTAALLAANSMRPKGFGTTRASTPPTTVTSRTRTPLPRFVPHFPPSAAPPGGNCQSHAAILLIIMSNYLCAYI